MSPDSVQDEATRQALIDLQARIDELLALIAALQARIEALEA